MAIGDMAGVLEDDEEIKQSIPKLTLEEQTAKDPQFVNRMIMSNYIAEAKGLDAREVFDNYEINAKSNGFTGNTANDITSARAEANISKKHNDVGFWKSWLGDTKRGGKRVKQFSDTMGMLEQKRAMQAAQSQIDFIDKKLKGSPKERASLPEDSVLASMREKFQGDLKKAQGGFTEEIQDYARTQAEILKVPMSKRLREFQESTGVEGAAKLLNPLTFIEVLTEEMIASTPALAAMIGGTAVAGLPGGIAGATAGEYAAGVSNNFFGYLQKNKVDTSNSESILAALDENPDLYSDALDYAMVKSIPEAVASGASVGLAKVGSPLFNVLVVQSGFAGAGVFASNLIMGEDQDVKELFTEMFIELGTGSVEVTAARLLTDKSPAFSQKTLNSRGESMSKSDYDTLSKSVTKEEFTHGMREDESFMSSKAYDGNEVAQETISRTHSASKMVEELGISEEIKASDPEFEVPQQPEPPKTATEVLQSDLSKKEKTQAISDLADGILFEADNISRVTKSIISKTEIDKSSIPESARGFVAKKIRDIGTGIDERLQKTINITERIGNISKGAKKITEEIDFNEVKEINRMVRVLEPFLDSASKVIKNLSKDQRAKLERSVLNGNFEAMRKLGFENIDAVRAMFDDVWKRTKEGGFVENFFPRAVKDLKGLRAHLRSNPQSDLSKILKAQEDKKGSALTQSEVSSIIEKAMKGEIRPPNSRSIVQVTPEMTKFYYSFIDSANAYIRRSARAMAINNAIGKKVDVDSEFNPDEASSEAAIQDLIKRLDESGDVAPDKVDELVGLMGSVIKFPPTPQFVQNLRFLTSLGNVTKASTVLIQFADFGTNVYANNIFHAIKGIGKQKPFIDTFGNEVKATLENVNVQALDQEVREQMELHKASPDFIFSLLKLADMTNKGNLLRSTISKWRSLSESNPERLQKEIVKLSGDAPFAKRVQESISNNTIDSDTRFALFMALNRFHPLGKGSHLKIYIDNPKFRSLFALKSFAFQRWSVIYQEALRGIILSISEGTASAIDGNNAGVKASGNQFAKAAYSLVSILSTMIVGESLMRLAIKEALGREYEEDESWADLYLEELTSLFPAFSPFAAKKEAQRGGSLFQIATSALSLPSPFLDQTLTEAYREMTKDDYNVRWDKSIRDVPYSDIFEMFENMTNVNTYPEPPPKKSTSKKRESIR